MVSNGTKFIKWPPESVDLKEVAKLAKQAPKSSMFWLGLGVLLLIYKNKRLKFKLKPTTLQMQTKLLEEMKQQHENQQRESLVRMTALEGVPLTMCVPFRNNSVSGEKGVVSFPEVGGKGLSLLQMASVPEITVPMGFVLPVSFFAAWTAVIRESPEFGEFLAGLHSNSPASIKEACQKLKQVCERQRFTPEMERAVTAGLAHILPAGATSESSSLVAVRSSSPEEDLVASSFAGGYETVLGVRTALKDLERAVAQVFASCYDERVFVYKMAQGFSEAAKDPKIAVVVQLQVDARAAGVCFSLDPVNNDQDVALITSAFGLGESVVSGLTSPDEFEIRHNNAAFDAGTDYKKRMQIIKKNLGKKQLAIRLQQGGGTVHHESSAAGGEAEAKTKQEQAEEASTESKEFSISDDVALRIVNELMAILKVYGKPMDTEWAVDQQGALMWLQARPITAHFQVPKPMATKPGEQKFLYMDMLSTVQGISGGLSVLGCEVLSRMLGFFFESVSGLSPIRNDGPNHAMGLFSGRSLVVNVSSGLLLAGKDNVATLMNQMDMLASKAIRDTDVQEYIPPYSSRPLTPALLPFRVMWRQPLFFVRLLRAYVNPSAGLASYNKGVPACFNRLQAMITELRAQDLPSMSVSLSTLMDRVCEVVLHGLMSANIPAMAMGRVKLMQVNECVLNNNPGAEERKWLDALTNGLPNNVTLELGFRCNELADCLEEQGLWGSLQEAKRGAINEERSLELLQVIQANVRAKHIWEDILLRYGHRAAEREIDVADPKYHDHPVQLVANVLRIFELSREQRPLALHHRLAEQRTKAARSLSQWLTQTAGPAVANKFDVAFSGYEKLGGVRETHKYLLVTAFYLIRLRVLQEGRWHHAAGRLDAVEDIFGLTMSDLQGAWETYRRFPVKGPSLDLRALVSARKVMVRKAGDPKLFDSRGREVRARAPVARPGVFVGFPVSAGSGVAVGRTKTLRSPDEKPLGEGEVLVARATDPGWTPLFVPAKAIVLEVGGPLQHGALVAREYGKPCVVGIEGVVNLFPDGTLVKVDGTLGTVELVKEDDETNR